MNANFQRSTLVPKEPCLVIARTDGEVGIVLTADALKEMLGGHGSGKLRVIQWMCWRCSRVALLASKTVPVRFLMVS
jgi:hypothetical protein